MNEADVRSYLRETEQSAQAARRRLQTLKGYHLDLLTRRRSNNASMAWHATTAVAGVALMRREIAKQSEYVAELENDVTKCRAWITEMEERRKAEEAERQRQREELRRQQERERAELEAELAAERDRARQESQKALQWQHAYEIEALRVSELTTELEDARERGGDSPDPPEPGSDPGPDSGGDDEGPDPSGTGPGAGPEGPGPTGGGAEAAPVREERDNYDDPDGPEPEENEHDREM